MTQSALIKLEADHAMRPGIECLIYSKGNPCQKKFLNLVNLLLLWCQEDPLKKPISTPLKSLGSDLDAAIASFIQSIPYGQTTSMEAVFSQFPTLPKEALVNWIKMNPYPLMIPTHRVNLEKGLSLKDKTLFSYLIDTEVNASR